MCVAQNPNQPDHGLPRQWQDHVAEPHPSGRSRWARPQLQPVTVSVGKLIAVVENEVGAISIDHTLIAQVRHLRCPCLCCRCWCTVTSQTIQAGHCCLQALWAECLLTSLCCCAQSVLCSAGPTRGSDIHFAERLHVLQVRVLCVSRVCVLCCLWLGTTVGGLLAGLCSQRADGCCGSADGSQDQLERLLDKLVQLNEVSEHCTAAAL